MNLHISHRKLFVVYASARVLDVTVYEAGFNPVCTGVSCHTGLTLCVQVSPVIQVLTLCVQVSVVIQV